MFIENAMILKKDKYFILEEKKKVSKVFTVAEQNVLETIKMFCF